MTGEKSGQQTSAVTAWRADQTHPENRKLNQSLSRFSHPKFSYGESDQLSFRLAEDAGLEISGKELGLFLGLPRKTVAGLPVIEHAEFGREVVTTSLNTQKKQLISRTLQLGHIFNLGQICSTSVDLNTDSLSMHTFITGSTGSGKSNTVYQLLNELHDDEIPFLVIEPAKGEYKNVFGHYSDVNVYSTNPKEAELIHLNPFLFPESVHILEHIDGLIEIFSACWPMYDAMPAFFKSAVLNAYQAVGWDLVSSTFDGNDIRYPDFSTLADELDRLILKSEYADEIKSNYRGALLTRVRSLSTGLNRFIFSDEQTPMEKLFDENCILDLSRVRSTETKALLMGIIIYMLNEYRQDQSSSSNQKLKHITVLEEAHHLLKNSGPNSSDLVTKSIEMITQTIAEIRTYGEGFIIADQSPSSVDLSVIKNTNTKIVLRTPEAADREAIGKSIGLSEQQINEISKLPGGVAAVYQNDWTMPVLVRVNKADISEIQFISEKTSRILPIRKARMNVLNMLLKSYGEENRAEFSEIHESILLLDINKSLKQKLLTNLEDFENFNGIELWDSDPTNYLKTAIPQILNLNTDELQNLREISELEQAIRNRLTNPNQSMVDRILQFFSEMETDENEL